MGKWPGEGLVCVAGGLARGGVHVCVADVGQVVGHSDGLVGGGYIKDWLICSCPDA